MSAPYRRRLRRFSLIAARNTRMRGRGTKFPDRFRNEKRLPSSKFSGSKRSASILPKFNRRTTKCQADEKVRSPGGLRFQTATGLPTKLQIVALLNFYGRACVREFLSDGLGFFLGNAFF